MVNLLRATLQSNACKSRGDAVDRGGPETGKIEECFKAEFRERSSHSKSCQMFVHALEEIEKLQTFSMLLLAISGKKRVWLLLFRAISQQGKEGI